MRKTEIRSKGIGPRGVFIGLEAEVSKGSHGAHQVNARCSWSIAGNLKLLKGDEELIEAAIKEALSQRIRHSDIPEEIVFKSIEIAPADHISELLYWVVLKWLSDEWGFSFCEPTISYDPDSREYLIR